MITTLRSPVAAFLSRHGAVAALDGAPCVEPPALFFVHGEDNADPDDALYLGTGPICPAALGWVARVLALAKGWTEPDLMIYGDDVVGLRGWQEGAYHEWQWKPSDPSLWDANVDPETITVMPDPMPTTPAARLKAVIEHVVSR